MGKKIIYDLIFAAIFAALIIGVLYILTTYVPGIGETEIFSKTYEIAESLIKRRAYSGSRRQNRLKNNE